jgi:hypothetical protein
MPELVLIALMNAVLMPTRHERAAGVPRVDRRVGLDEILELLDTDVRAPDHHFVA